MVISHKKKFIFIKTAGISVELYFEKHCMNKGDWTVSHARDEYVSKSGIIGYKGSDPENKKWYNHMPTVDIK